MTPTSHPTAPPPRAEIAPEMRCEDIHGVEVCDLVHNGERLVWVGREGHGRWITPQQFRDMVAVLVKFAQGLSE